MAFNTVESVQDTIPLHHVIVSVYDKSGLDSLLLALLENCPGIRFYATGGSYVFIKALLADRAGAHLVQMADYTGQPEMQGGLVKTLDWKIYLGLLAERGNQAHTDDLCTYKAIAFDMVIGNLYDFATAAAAASSFEQARQHIDIGGPSMLRAAAKNFLRVASVCRPDLYGYVMEALKKNRGCLSLKNRAWLAGQTFCNQAGYDAAVAEYFATQVGTLLEKSYAIS
jgi:phosphoribosylaminoimidazolecarboxamide formyltransferase/IMP cyclohydrolase